MSSILVAVYWKARNDSLEDCANMLREHFAALAETSEALERWHETAWRRPRHPKEVPVGTLESLAALFANGVHRRDDDKSVIVDLGWSMGLWNGDRDGLSASTSVHCGCTAHSVGNNALLYVSSDEGEALSKEAAVQLLKRLIWIWRPDTGLVERSVWDPAREDRDEFELATYTRPRWPWARREVRLTKAYFD